MESRWKVHWYVGRNLHTPTPPTKNKTILMRELLAAGAAFSKHLIHLYAYSGSNDLRQHLEVIECYACFCKPWLNFKLTSLCLQIDAHAGSVNDLAFAYPNKQLCVITCGDDKFIKVTTEYPPPSSAPERKREKRDMKFRILLNISGSFF